MPPDPTSLLYQLIRFESVNPPGNEAECIAFIEKLLNDAGIATTRLEKVPGRPNLIARLKGAGQTPPLLLYGHVDVVPVDGQSWTYPPFRADIHDGYMWGRGALDMKGGVAMLLTAFIRAAEENTPLPGDVILCIVSDEERGGRAGAHFLVNEHPDLFRDVRWALGEFGGFALYLGGKRFYPIQVAEKQVLWLRATVRGAAGHASVPLKGGAMAKLARLLTALDENRLPVHITDGARAMFDGIAAGVDAPMDIFIRSLLDPAQTDTVLDALGDMGTTINPLVRHTVVPTVLHSGEATNVIPASISVDLDARLLPGFTPFDVIAELRPLIGDEPELEIVGYDPGPGAPDMSQFETLAGILREADPAGIPVPLMLSGVTDGRFFAQLGIQTYGFLPMNLPEGFNFQATIHAADERIPVSALDFGTQAVFTALTRMGL